MSNLENLCDQYFKSTDFYEIIGVETNATPKEIKKAYHTRSLLIHPDRVAESDKLVSTEKFKILAQIYSILQDADKRAVYDETGTFNENDFLDKDDESWKEYWRQMFKTVSNADICSYKEQYIGSKNEIQDVKKAYIRTKGNMDLLFEYVPFLDCENEERIVEIVRKLVEDGEVKNYPKFFKELNSKKLNRKRKFEQEKKELEEGGGMEELEAAMNKRSEARAKNFFSMIDAIETKYAEKGKGKAKNKKIKTK